MEFLYQREAKDTTSTEDKGRGDTAAFATRGLATVDGIVNRPKAVLIDFTEKNFASPVWFSMGGCHNGMA